MIGKFATALGDAFESKPIPPKLQTEGALEREFAIPVAKAVVKRFPSVALFIHPWSSKTCCNPKYPLDSPSGRVLGCPRCWTHSKQWATVAAFGTKHTCDMVARDKSRTLAVEIKLVDATRSRMPNGDIQRFLGQCALAAVKHDEVIGLCGYRGTLNVRFEQDSNKVKNWNKKQNIRLAFVKVK